MEHEKSFINGGLDIGLNLGVVYNAIVRSMAARLVCIYCTAYKHVSQMSKNCSKVILTIIRGHYTSKYLKIATCPAFFLPR